MLYNVENKSVMLDTLQTRVSGIIDVCIALVNEGYSLNKAKSNKVSWTTIMIDAFENIDVLSEEQHHNLETLYDKVMSL